MVLISDDVGGVAQSLHDLDPHLRLRYSEAGEYYVVYWTEDPSQSDEDVEREERGSTYLVTTAQELDQRLVQRIEKIYWECRQPGYSLAKKLDEMDAKGKSEDEKEFTEKRGPLYEELAHAMRKDTHRDKRRAFIGDGIPAA